MRHRRHGRQRAMAQAGFRTLEIVQMSDPALFKLAGGERRRCRGVGLRSRPQALGRGCSLSPERSLSIRMRRRNDTASFAAAAAIARVSSILINSPVLTSFTEGDVQTSSSDSSIAVSRRCNCGRNGNDGSTDTLSPRSDADDCGNGRAVEPRAFSQTHRRRVPAKSTTAGC